MEWMQGQYQLSDDAARLDLDAICALLRDTYWAADRPRALIHKSVENSVCLGLFHGGHQVGFARAVTDHATFAWIADVIIHPDHRGHGLGKWMVATLLHLPAVQTITQALRTKDAHTLYEQFGFERIEYMRRSKDGL